MLHIYVTKYCVTCKGIYSGVKTRKARLLLLKTKTTNDPRERINTRSLSIGIVPFHFFLFFAHLNLHIYLFLELSAARNMSFLDEESRTRGEIPERDKQGESPVNVSPFASST